jgi:hypothetical protein
MAARCPYFAVEESSRGIRSGESPAAALRRILATPGAHQAPCCYDALGARLVERAGFQIGFMGGACASVICVLVCFCVMSIVVPSFSR